MHIRTRLLFTLPAILIFGVAPRAAFSQPSIRFAVVGDYGDTPPNSGNVATLIQSWAPEFVITVGDNNYTNPTPAPPNHYPAWDGAVGQYYHQFIKYPAGSGSVWAGSGSATNKFFPSLGNHDWAAGIAGWGSYFELPGNEHYYDFVKGPVHFFVVDSDPAEPDGITAGSVQGQWLQTQLGASTSPWKIVYFHHPPYTSATRGNNVALQWPFALWGASAVLTGHEHHYERIMKNGFPYFVDGAGGRSLYGFSSTPEPGSVVRYSGNYGAMRVYASVDSLVFEFYSIPNGGTLIDRHVLLFSPLPIQLASFTASVLSVSSVRLDWITLSETNNYGFEVQKSVEAMTGYATIPNVFIPGHGTTTEPQTYTYTDNSATTGTWYYRLKQMDLDGTIHYADGVHVDVLTDVDGVWVPKEFTLEQNYPNPFNPTTSFEFHLPKATDVTLKVYTILGSEVQTVLSNVKMGSGVHEMKVDASRLASGLYIYRMTTPEFTQTRKMIVLK